MRPLALALLLLAGVTLPARADDSSAILGAGGLVLARTDKISLVSEDLFLSPSAVKISYRFRNLSLADIETIVAFPMPDLRGDPNSTLQIPDPLNNNFLKFRAAVDGKPVDSQLEQRAFVINKGKPDVEVTDRLKALNIPVVPTVEATEKALHALNAAQRKELITAQIIDGPGGPDDPYAADPDNPNTTYAPLWTLRSKFWRKQMFPAGKDVIVQENYVPGLGGLSSLNYGSPDMSARSKAFYKKQYCTDEAFSKAARGLYERASADDGRTFQSYEQYLSYIITSGGNWAGPIGDFRLVVDKGDQKTLVSFCGDGVHKTSATTFEATWKNYMPTRDIDILFLKSDANPP